MSGKMELLAGPLVDEALSGDEVTVFEYGVNQAGFIAVLVAGGLFFLGAAMTWFFSGLDATGWTVLFVCLGAVGMAFSTMAAYWHGYASENVVGFSDERLFVGNRKKGLWAISWELLDSKAMGFEDMSLSRYSGGLQMNVGGQRINLHLANAITHLDNLEEFMGGVLLRLLDDEERAELLERIEEEEAREAEAAALEEE